MDQEKEKKSLDKLALIVLIYLVAFSVIAFFAGYGLFGKGGIWMVVASALIGISGSGVAAFTSCLDRYATGFELEDGTKVPEGAKGKETFNKRMARWFVFRPFLGLLVAPVFIWGMEYFVSDPAKYTSSINRLGFSAFVGGLLAKSVIDLIKGLFKNIFKA
jgi:RsiW-degrading membrane proteinase PrsW (M82 family)